MVVKDKPVQYSYLIEIFTHDTFITVVFFILLFSANVLWFISVLMQGQRDRLCSWVQNITDHLQYYVVKIYFKVLVSVLLSENSCICMRHNFQTFIIIVVVVVVPGAAS
jgi:hypothetical protein